MICPACNKGTLKPTKIVAGLPAMCCNKCGGYLLSMLSYRMWVEDNPQLIAIQQKIEELDETAKTIICPKCQKLMSKYRISSETQNKLDSCGNCGELWVDHGEWELLLSLGLIDKVSSILSQPWQSSVRQQENEAAYELRHETIMGEDGYSKIRVFRDWANQHPHKDVIKNYVARVENK